MITVALLFKIAALVFFLLAGFKVPAGVDWTNLGYASLVAFLLVGNLH